MGDVILVYFMSVRSGEPTYDTEHHLVVSEVRERLAVSKQITHRFHMERFNVKQLNLVEDKEQYWVEISNRLCSSGKLRC
jgi:hypothetical protein